MSTSKSCEARLEYVTAEEVNCLKLLELDFGGTILLICPEYIQCYALTGRSSRREVSLSGVSAGLSALATCDADMW